ncbi:sensor domain-containing diguanylate cyclase [Aliikangiella sp. IMCC44359]|uniref:sensor domain-containing diguanylate cyclase n=1 Tax=Aliikangiella sp. IMCC44359 TaxID=3459125 RepID=UPI00403AF451
MNNHNKPEYFDVDFYATLVDTIQDGVFVLKDGRFVLVNQAFAEMLGETKEALTNSLFSKKIAPEYVDIVVGRYLRHTSGLGQKNEYQIEVLHTEGYRIVVQLKVEVFNGKDDHVYMVCSVHDVTFNIQLIKKLQDSEREFKQIIENLPSIFYRTDAFGNLSMASSYALRMLGYTAEEAIGQPMTEFYANPDEREETLQRIIDNKGIPVEVETLMLRADGSTVWVSTNAYARYDDADNFLGVEGVSLNITKQKNREYELKERAIKDSLTKLVNRSGLLEHLDKALSRAKRQRSHVSIIFIDLDDFKLVNDSFGHINGDYYLVEFSQRLNDSFRVSDVVARIGGDEFVVLLDDNTMDDSIKDLLLRLEKNMRSPIGLDGEKVHLKYSYGIATYPKHALTSFELLKYADEQMYNNKKKNSKTTSHV